MPLAFLALEATCAGERGARKGIRAIVVLASLLALAIAVEFAQGFFPPRTVSRNDLVAEGAGILIGAVAWLVAGGRFRAILAGLPGRPGRGGQGPRADGRARLRRACGLSVRLRRVDRRARSAAAWTRHGPRLRVVRVLADGDLRRPHRRRDRGGRRIRGGMVLVARKHDRTHDCATCCGRRSRGARGSSSCRCSWCRAWSRAPRRWRGRAASRWVCSSGATLRDRWTGSETGRGFVSRSARVGTVSRAAGGRDGIVPRHVRVGAGRLDPSRGRALMPFYYHYYVSEQWALVSAALHAALYAPVGALAALARLVPPAGVPRTGRAAVLVAGALALLVETGKLFAGRRPDPTDLVLAMAGSYVAFRVVTHFIVDRGAPSPAATAAGASFLRPAAHVVFGPLTIAGAILLLGATLALVRYPLGATWLAVGPLRLWRRAAPLAERMVARTAGTVACPRPRTVDRLAVPRRVRSLRDGDDRRAVRSSAASSALAIPGGTRGAAGDRRAHSRCSRSFAASCRWTRCRRTCCGASSIGRTRCARRVPCYGRCCCWRSFAGGATAPHAIWRSSLAG